MNLWGRFFGRKDGVDLSSVTPEDIRADEIALERQEQRIDQEVEQCQQRIDVIARQVVEAGQKSKVRAATRQILQLKERISDKEHSQAMISKSLIALGRLRRVIEGSEHLVKSGVLGRLQSLPQADLSRLLCGEMARSEVASKGLNAVVELLEGAATDLEPVSVDSEAARLMAAFDAAIEAGDPTLVTNLVGEEVEAERAAVMLRVG